jgi:formyltetrahydrofolate synthetase
MGGARRTVLNWASFHKGQRVRFYTGDGWKKGVVGKVDLSSCTIRWTANSNDKLTRVYDTRNVQPL